MTRHLTGQINNYNNYGEDFTKKLLKANNEKPSFTIRVNTLKTNREELIKSLTNDGFEIEDTNFKNAINILNPRGIIDTKYFENCLFRKPQNRLFCLLLKFHDRLDSVLLQL